MPRMDMPEGANVAVPGEFGLVQAPLSNKGNPTSGGFNNLMVVESAQPVRLVNNATGEIVFEGVGLGAAKQASDLAAQLTAQGGRKANWDLQTGPSGLTGQASWKNIAEENPNRSTLGEIANIAGTALPIAMIPLTMGASAPLAGLGTVGTIGLGAGVGAASSALKGDNILKGALMGGLTSAGGELLSGPLKGIGLGADAARAVGTGIGATTGGLATGQNLTNSLLGGVAAGGLTYLGGKAFGPKGDPLIDEWAKSQGIYDLASLDAPSIADGFGVAPSISAPVSAGAISSPNITATAQIPTGGSPSFSVPGPNINVTGTRATETAGGSPSFAVPVGSVPGPNIDVTALKDLAVRDEGSVAPPGVPKSDYTVTAKTDTTKLDEGSAVGGPFVPAGSTKGPDLDVTGTRSDVTETGGSTPPPFDLLDLVQDPKVQEDLKEGRDDEKGGGVDLKDVLAVLGVAGAVGGGGSGTNRVSPGGQQLQSIFSASLPTPGAGGFKVGGLDYTTPAERPATDWYRYAMGPAMDIPQGVNLARATSPYAGFGPGTLGQETFNRVTAGAGPEVYGRQPGFTGTTTNQTLGDTQVVDGTTWVWGGPQRGWEMQYIDPATGEKKVLPGVGGGDANVSSFANNPTIARNEPYFAQNTANIPGWADTYHGWQKAMIAAGVPQETRYAAEREFMNALEQKPFGSAIELVDFARDLLNRSRQPVAKYAGGSMGYSRGSSRESFAVNGPGTGRSDDIPAVLSDGEYVIDAETVALLGDGSSKAGAKKLDEMRVNLRKHKGRNLAKGKFSVNAKRPEKYLSGGRA